MTRWLMVAPALLLLPACPPSGTWYRPAPRARPPENDALGALPVRGPVVAPQRQPVQRGDVMRVTTETDEFTGRTSHRLEIGLSRTDRFVAFGMTGGPGVLATMQLPANGGWRYLECHHVAALADDARIAPTDVEHDGRVVRGGVIEHIGFRLSPEDLALLAAAERIRFRVCSTVYEFPARSREVFAEFIRRLEPQLVLDEPSQEIDTTAP